jgi:hypothetical protein
MLVNRSNKTSLDKSLQLLVLGAVSLSLLGLGPASAQAPTAPNVAPAPVDAPPASTSAPAVPIAPAAVPVKPAQVAPPSSVAADTPAPQEPASNPHPTALKPGVNIYNGTNASTLNFANTNPALRKPSKPSDPWKMAAIVESNPSYIVEVKYPQFDPVKGSDPSKLNEEIKRYVMAQLDAIRPSMPSKLNHVEGPKPLSYINGVCNVSMYNENLCSVAVDLTSYAYQSAHPIEAITTFNFRLDTNQQFGLKELFRSDYKYIPTLSKICIGTLSEGLDEEGVDWVRRGAAPEEKNFVKFQLTPRDLIILFDPYTVDNGADGFKTVPVNWDRIRGGVSTDKPFRKLILH